LSPPQRRGPTLESAMLASAPRSLRLLGQARSLGRRELSAFSGGRDGGGSGKEARGTSSSWHVGVVIVPQRIAWVVERLGKFHKVLDPGLHFLIPFADRISYRHSLKEEAVLIPNQQAITKDNVTISIDGVLYLRVVDAIEASYGVNDPIFAVMQLAQTTMRSEIGKMTLDKTFEERDALNKAIVTIVNEAAQAWGIKCLRYEIKDIIPPTSIKQAMEMQAEAERRKRAEILQSEGDRQSEVNLAQGKRQSAILFAEGEAQAIMQRSKATAEGIKMLSAAITGSPGGQQAASLRVAEQWVTSWKEMAKSSNTIVVPANASDASSMITSAMSIFKQVAGDSPVFRPSGQGGVAPADGSAGSFGTEVPPSLTEEDVTAFQDASNGEFDSTPHEGSSR